MTTTGLHLTDRDGVRWIELDRPASRNGLTPEVIAAIRDAVADAAAVRVIAIGGRGGSFCSGLDLKDAMGRMGASAESDMRDAFQGAIRAIVESPRPTIALVDGAAAGFGCDLALACDVRLLSARARFGEIFVHRGLMPDGGGTYHLPRIVGLGRALDLFYTGAMVEAEEAYRIGLGTRLWPVERFADDAAAYVGAIAKGPPMALRLIKRAVYAALEGDVGAALDREATGQLECLRSRDFAEGVASFLGKREPVFSGE